MSALGVRQRRVLDLLEQRGPLTADDLLAALQWPSRPEIEKLLGGLWMRGLIGNLPDGRFDLVTAYREVRRAVWAIK